jgi:hypothetical protein
MLFAKLDSLNSDKAAIGQVNSARKPIRSWAAANGTSVRLRDRDQPASVCAAFPGILDLSERNTLGLDAQCAVGCAVHHLLERVGEYVPRRHASGS